MGSGTAGSGHSACTGKIRSFRIRRGPPIINLRKFVVAIPSEMTKLDPPETKRTYYYGNNPSRLAITFHNVVGIKVSPESGNHHLQYEGADGVQAKGLAIMKSDWSHIVMECDDFTF